MQKPILYCILVHDSPRQTLRLLRAIYNETDHFVVHVDRSAAPEYQRLLGAVGAVFPRIQVISNHVCAWGGYSLVAAELDMIRAGLKLGAGWTHAIFLSGTHLPVWPMAMIRDWVDEGVSFVNWHEIPSSKERPAEEWLAKIWDRCNWYYEEVPGVGMKRGEWAGPPPFIYAKGPQWIALARDHAEYAVRPGTDPVRERLARTAVPDEAFFQTVICNSEFRGQRDGSKICSAAQWLEGQGNPRILGLDAYVDFGMMTGAPFVRKIADVPGDEAEMERAIERMIGPVEVPEFGQAVLSKLRLPMD